MTAFNVEFEKLINFASSVDTSKIETGIPFAKASARPFWNLVAMDKGKAELYIHGVIGNGLFDDVSATDLIKELNALNDVKEITVFIRSEGGSVFDGLAIYDALRMHPAKIITEAQGIAASMATIVFSAGDERRMSENSQLMIHNPWTVAGGDEHDFRAVADLLGQAKQIMLNIYQSVSSLSRDELVAVMDKETWYTGDTAEAGGFATEVTRPIELAACITGIDLSGFSHNPFKDLLNQSVKSDSIKEESTMPNTATPNALDDKNLNVDVDAIAAQAATNALAMEAKRQGSIRGIFGHFQGQDDLMNECLSDQGLSASDAQAKLLAALSKGTEPLGADTRATTTEDQSTKFKAGFSSAILARAGVGKHDSANEFRGLTLAEGARATLEARGISTGHMDKLSMVGAAFTHSSSDYGTLLENIANKSMLKGFEETEETFQEWTTRGVLTDFKATKRVDLNTFPDLLEVGEGSEYKYGTMGDRGESVQLATYGRMFGITRQAIINDDLSAFTRIPQKMGRAAPRTIGNLVYAILNSNPAMSDGTALFHADHKNLGSGAVLSSASVDAMRVLMATQKDPGENATALNIRLAHLIVPVQLEGLAKVVTESETEISATNSNSKRPNSVRGIAGVISDARLTGNAWFGAGSAAMNDTVEVSYLDGNESPYLEQQAGWSIDGVEFKVRLDAAVKAIDFRALAKNAGA